MNTPHTSFLMRAWLAVATSLLVLLLLVPRGAGAAIVSRSPALAYDSTLNVTWVTNASLFETLALGVGGAVSLAEDVYQNDPYVESLPSEYSGPRTVLGYPPHTHLYELESVVFVGAVPVPYPDFRRDPATPRVNFNWFAARAFVNYLNDTSYLGHNDWRLPKMLDGACVVGVNSGSNNCEGGPWNEVQSLYQSLGAQPGTGFFGLSDLSDYRKFTGGLGQRDYWLSDQIERFVPVFDAQGNIIGQTFAPNEFPNALVAGNALDGDTFSADKRFRFFGAMILRDGDTLPTTDNLGGNPSPVPLPAPWTLLAAPAGLLGWRARRA